jgi:hypothetical protein
VLVFVHLVLRQYQVGLVRLVSGGLPEQLVLSRGDHCKAKINYNYPDEKKNLLTEKRFDTPEFFPKKFV